MDGVDTFSTDSIFFIFVLYSFNLNGHDTEKNDKSKFKQTSANPVSD